MLSKRARLSRTDFSHTFARGAHTRTRHFRHIYTDTQSGQAPRFAVVVSKKTAQRAHIRNMLRRRVYRALGEIHAGMPKTGDHIILVMGSAGELSPAELVAELVALFGAGSLSR